MKIFEELAKKDHEQVAFCSDKETGLKAIIAIHNTTLGPALGGCRIWPYESEEAALRDVLRLSRGMTYKSAAAGLNLGGGKAVIIGEAKRIKSEKLFRVFGRFVQTLGGRYITAEDVGTSVQDMEWVRMETNFVTGISRTFGGSGDPSPLTAFGVYQGIRAALTWHFGSDSLEEKTVLVQGVGQVGFALLQHLIPSGARVIASDVDDKNIRRVLTDYPSVQFVAADKIYDIPCDIFAPCALGGVVNDDTISRLQCRIIAGSANNVLADEDKHSVDLEARGILYAPDFVISAGGLINVANELVGYERKQALRQVTGIYDIVMSIFQIAKEENVTTQKAAKTLAERRIYNLGRIKHTYVGIPMLKRARV
jgi:leucine dehydrogenase